MVKVIEDPVGGHVTVPHLGLRLRGPWVKCFYMQRVPYSRS